MVLAMSQAMLDGINALDSSPKHTGSSTKDSRRRNKVERQNRKKGRKNNGRN